MVVLNDFVLGTHEHNHRRRYDVFISFRGADTRNNFTDHLYNALLDAGITTFLDDQDIETGQDLKPELANAIRSSRASIIVLSKNYATSTWCLDELALILEQRLTSDHIVIPVFYHVEPTDVRKQQGSFGDALAKHTQRMEREINAEKCAQKMIRWNKALTEVADLKGKDMNNRRETEFIDEIVTNIYHSLGGSIRKNLPLLFGMEDSIEFITSWLKDGSSHTFDILTILGMGGIGKTSLAKYVHGSHCHLFKRSSFIESIDEKCAAHANGLLDIQKQLCSDISKKSHIQVYDILEYTSMIENSLTRKKVFIVLDNVDSVQQLHALLGNKAFHPGSKIIITAKDASLIEKYAPINPIVQPKYTKHLLAGLHKKASLQLLSHHAFMSNGPKKGYEEVSEKLLVYCEGHPLALKVLGESLCNKTLAEWEECIDGLKEETDSRIKKALQMSYDSLPSNNEKELFKHIACFFVQKDRVFAETILRSCGFRTLQGIRNLIDRCLLSISPNNILMMHQLVQEMGKDVVRQESLYNPEERSRLWCHEESFYVLEENKGTGNTKGLVLDMKMLEIEKLDGSIELETYALSKMYNLVLLHLNFVQLSGSYKNFPQKLRWLCMHGLPLKTIPLDVPMQNLVALDMSYSNIESFDMSCSNQRQPRKRVKVSGSRSKNKKLLGSLKFLTLSFCERLLSLGGFLELPAVERLIVRKCTALTEVCESIEQCVELVHLDLSYCNNLKKLPRTIGMLTKVKTLLLDGCDLDELPTKMKDMESPETGMVKNIGINYEASYFIVESIPSNLKFFSVSLPSSLIRLSLANNNLSNESFPVDFSCLSMLKDLCLDGNPFVSLPSCVRTLPRLETLGMNNCLKLMSVEHPPCTLRQLGLYNNCRKPDYKILLRKILFDPEMAPLMLIADRNLLAPSSFKVEGMIKIQPLADVEEKLLHSLGWTEFGPFFDNRCMVTNYNYGGPQESRVQMYYEFGIFSTVFRAGKHPAWVLHQTKGPSISFTIPSSSMTLRGLNFCVVGKFFELPKMKISNITKNRTWIYNHVIQSINMDGVEWLTYLSHWMFGTNEMDVGDQITVTLEKYSTASMFLSAVSFVHDNGSMEEKDALSYYKSWNHIIGGDLCAFQLLTGEYFLHSVDFLRNLYSGSFNAHFKGGSVLLPLFASLSTATDLLFGSVFLLLFAAVYCCCWSSCSIRPCGCLLSLLLHLTSHR